MQCSFETILSRSWNGVVRMATETVDRPEARSPAVPLLSRGLIAPSAPHGNGLRAGRTEQVRVRRTRKFASLGNISRFPGGERCMTWFAPPRGEVCYHRGHAEPPPGWADEQPASDSKPARPDHRTGRGWPARRPSVRLDDGRTAVFPVDQRTGEGVARCQPVTFARFGRDPFQISAEQATQRTDPAILPEKPGPSGGLFELSPRSHAARWPQPRRPGATFHVFVVRHPEVMTRTTSWFAEAFARPTDPASTSCTCTISTNLRPRSRSACRPGGRDALVAAMDALIGRLEEIHRHRCPRRGAARDAEALPRARVEEQGRSHRPRDDRHPRLRHPHRQGGLQNLPHPPRQARSSGGSARSTSRRSALHVGEAAADHGGREGGRHACASRASSSMPREEAIAVSPRPSSAARGRAEEAPLRFGDDVASYPRSCCVRRRS